MIWARYVLRVAAAHRLLVGAVLAAALGASLAQGGDPLVARLAGWGSGSLGQGRTSVQALAAGSAPTGTAVGREVTVHWAQLELSGGTPVAAYRVRRYSLAGAEQTVLVGCAGARTELTCVEDGVPPGSWRYTITPLQLPWIGDESPRSATVTIGPAQLTFTGSTTLTTLPATLNGTVSGFIGDDAITFHLDSPTGPTLVGTPTVVGPIGTAAVSVTIPVGTDDAPHSVFVTGSDGLAASAPITVVDTPTLVALEAFDVNGNGKLDRVTATFDETLAPYTAGTSPWTLTTPPTGVTLASVSVSGSVATLTLNEGTAITTAVGSFRVTLASNAAGIRDPNGHRGSFAITAVVDRAAPVPAAAAQMLDSVTKNGKVDRVTVLMSETLAAYTAGTTPVTLAAAPSGATVSTVTISTTTLTVTLAEGAGAADTTVGSFTVAVAAAAGGVRDAAGNLSSFGPLTPLDKAAPFPVTRLGFDDDLDARFDRVTVGFSEDLAPVTAPATIWGLGTVPSGGTLASASVGGATATLTLDEGTGTATTAVTTAFRLGITSSATGVRDAAGNLTAVTAGTTTTITDRAVPLRLVTTLLDATGNGKVDRVTVTWTEALTTYTAGVTPWTLTNVPSGGTLTAASVSTVTATLTITEGAGAADTAVGTMTVALATSATGIRDTAGNLASFAAIAPVDGARPVAMTMGGTNGTIDGRIEPGDTMTITFSEPLATASVPTATTVTLADPAGAGNDTLNLTGITATARDTGSNLYISADGTSAAFDSTVALSGDGLTVTVTVGPTCSGTGCTAVGTATAAANLSYLGATTLTDRTGQLVTATAKTFSQRLF